MTDPAPHTGECFPGEDETYVRPATADEATTHESEMTDRAARIAAAREILDMLEVNPSIPLPYNLERGDVTIYGFSSRIDYTFAARDFVACAPDPIHIIPGVMSKMVEDEEDRPKVTLRSQFGPITVNFESNGIETDRL